MQCHEFDERMHWLLDERQVPQCDRQLLAHAQECSSCGQILRAQELLFRGVGSDHSPALPVSFAARVVSQVECPVQVRPHAAVNRPWILAGTVIATAAAALIALTVVMNRQSLPPEVPAVATPAKPATENSHRKALAVSKTSPKNSTPSRPDSPPTPEQPGPSRDVAQGSAEVDSLEQYSQALQSLASQVPQAVDRLDEVEEATPGLRPVRTSFTLAIGTIRRTMPRKQPPPKPSKRDSGWLWPADSQNV